MRKIYFLFLLLCLTANFAFAQNATMFSPEVKRIAVFKNGYAFTYREGIAQTNNGWVYTTNAPIGVLGTVWGYSTSPGVQVSQMLATESDKSQVEPLVSVGEVLLANEGKRIRFIDGYNKQFEGTYSLLGKNYLLKPNETGENASPESLTIALNTETGIVLFPANSIRNIEIIGQPKMDKTTVSKENRLMLNVSGAKDGQNVNLGIAALERGIRWIPAYRVEVKGNPINEVKLKLEANIINELTDLKDSEVNFVVGVPHFLFQDVMSPLSINTAFAGVSSYFQTGRGGQNSYSNAIMSQVSSTEDSSYNGNTPSPTVFGEEKLTSFSDLILTRNLVGEILNATDSGKISRQGLNLKSVNPNSTVRWNLMLPNGEKEIKYTYKIYVSR